MRRTFVLFSLLAFSSLPCRAATLYGTVTDAQSNGLAGVGVSLALSGTSTTTDALGAWSLDWTTGVMDESKRSALRWTGKSVELNLVFASEVRIEAFSANGVTLARINRPQLEAGLHRIPFASKGVAWLRVTVNGQTETLMVGFPSGSRDLARNAPATRSLVVPDTLLFTWKGTVKQRQLLKSMPTSGILVELDTATKAIPWQTGITYGTVSDSAGQSYRTVQIGGKWWMAENLNYAGKGRTIGQCYNNSADSCAKYGRLYTWAEAVGLPDSCNVKVCGTRVPSKPTGICPTGWHVPSDSEWTAMQRIVEPTNTTDGTKLKSMNGWQTYGMTSGNDTDLYGFRALPGGYFYGTSFSGVGYGGYWWSATEFNASGAWYRLMLYNIAGVFRDINNFKTSGLSLRCSQD